MPSSASACAPRPITGRRYANRLIWRQSTAPLNLAADLDGVILVADARDPNGAGLQARRAAIEARGGVVAGLILNRTERIQSAA